MRTSEYYTERDVGGSRRKPAEAPLFLTLIIALHATAVVGLSVFRLMNLSEDQTSVRTDNIVQYVAYCWDDKQILIYVGAILSMLTVFELFRERDSGLWLLVAVSFFLIALDYCVQLYLIHGPPLNTLTRGKFKGQILYSSRSMDILRAPLLLMPGILLGLHLVFRSRAARADREELPPKPDSGSTHPDW